MLVVCFCNARNPMGGLARLMLTDAAGGGLLGGFWFRFKRALNPTLHATQAVKEGCDVCFIHLGFETDNSVHLATGVSKCKLHPFALDYRKDRFCCRLELSKAKHEARILSLGILEGL